MTVIKQRKTCLCVYYIYTYIIYNGFINKIEQHPLFQRYFKINSFTFIFAMLICINFRKYGSNCLVDLALSDFKTITNNYLRVKVCENMRKFVYKRSIIVNSGF